MPNSYQNFEGFWPITRRSVPEPYYCPRLPPPAAKIIFSCTDSLIIGETENVYYVCNRCATSLRIKTLNVLGQNLPFLRMIFTFFFSFLGTGFDREEGTFQGEEMYDVVVQPPNQLVSQMKTLGDLIPESAIDPADSRLDPDESIVTKGNRSSSWTSSTCLFHQGIYILRYHEKRRIFWRKLLSFCLFLFFVCKLSGRVTERFHQYDRSSCLLPRLLFLLLSLWPGPQHILINQTFHFIGPFFVTPN